MRKFDLSLRSSRSSYFATFRHQLTILSKTDAWDEEKWLNMLGTFVKDWFRYESHFVHGRDSLVDILKERGLLSEFFFSSRRRHTRCLSDWSSDVCSSDLIPPAGSMSRTDVRVSMRMAKVPSVCDHDHAASHILPFAPLSLVVPLR